MGSITNRFPRLFTAAKVAALLIIVLITLVLMSLVLLAAVAVYLAVTGGNTRMAAEIALAALTDNTLVSTGYMVLQNIFLVLVTVLFAVLVDRKKPVTKALGLSREHKPLRQLCTGMLINLAFILILVLIILLTGVSKLETDGFTKYGVLQVAVSFVAIMIGTLFVGIGEETVFRGYVQPTLAGRFGLPAALIVTSAIFAAFHSLTPFAKLGPLYILGVFSLSLLLGYLAVITGTIYASIGFHFIQDFLALQVFNFAAEQTLGAYPLLLFSKPGEIYLGSFFLGGWDDLIGILLSLAILAVLYACQSRKKKEGEVPPSGQITQE